MMRNIVAVLADFAAHVLPPLGKCAIALVFGVAIVPQGPSIRTDALQRQKKNPGAMAGALGVPSLFQRIDLHLIEFQ